MGAPPDQRKREARPREPGADERARLRRFYSDTVVYEAQIAAHDEGYFRKYLDVLVRFLPSRVDNVLELGAGSGAALAGYVRRRSPARAVGLELSPRNLEAIQGRGAPFVAVGGDALELPFAAGSFDVVTCFQVIEHLPSIPRALDETVRVLKRPGWLVIGMPNHASLLTPLQDMLRGRTRLAFGVTGRSGALRWLLRNARIALSKRSGRNPRYLYCEPRLDVDVRGGDSDAVYYACPLDLLRDLAGRGGRLIGSDAVARWGTLGRFVPSELRGSMVAIWRLD